MAVKTSRLVALNKHRDNFDLLQSLFNNAVYASRIIFREFKGDV